MQDEVSTHVCGSIGASPVAIRYDETAFSCGEIVVARL